MLRRVIITKMLGEPCRVAGIDHIAAATAWVPGTTQLTITSRPRQLGVQAPPKQYAAVAVMPSITDMS